MAISRRKSRKIVVDHQEFRWSPSQDLGFVVLLVQLSYGSEKKLEVVISDDKNVVIDNGSYLIELGSTGCLIVTSSLVETVVPDT